VQNTEYRSLISVVMLVAGSWVAAVWPPTQTAEARWPIQYPVYAAPGWAVGAPKAHSVPRKTIVERTYLHSDGTVANVTISTSTEATRIYGPGVDTGLLGDGFGMTPAPIDLVPPVAGREGALAQRHDGKWLMVYAFGERRGLLGNGPRAWGAAASDLVLGRPNDYYMVQIVTKLDRLDGPATRRIVALADTILPRIAGWYAG
jgi:hypothetical protein